MEPFLSKANAEDETVKSFISRRLGTELFDYAADPFITGIYAGDPSKLSMRYAFPALWNAEQTSGSLIKGMLKARKSKSEVRVKRSVISFPNGLSELTDALREVLKDRIEFLNGAADLNRSTSRFQVSSSRMLEAERVVCTLPAYEASGIVSPLSPELSVRLRSIEYSPVAVAFLGYRNNQFTNIPEGFGGLIPSKEHRTILGIIFSSSNFPNRAPKDHSLITVMMGGALHREIENQSENNILEIAKKEVCDLLRPDGEPSFQDLQLWKRAIPQYNIGYGAVLESIVKVESDNPGLYFLGNYRGGISIGSCIRNATELAKRLV
jgi:oxygen-dependent protoporphyrinogen oxidase